MCTIGLRKWCGTNRQYDSTTHVHEAKDSTPSMLCFRLSPVAKFDAAEAYGSPLDAGAAVAAAAGAAAAVLGAGVAVGAEAGADAAVAEAGAALQSISGCQPAYETVRTLKVGMGSCCKCIY